MSRAWLLCTCRTTPRPARWRSRPPSRRWVTPYNHCWQDPGPAHPAQHTTTLETSHLLASLGHSCTCPHRPLPQTGSKDPRIKITCTCTCACMYILACASCPAHDGPWAGSLTWSHLVTPGHTWSPIRMPTQAAVPDRIKDPRILPNTPNRLLFTRAPQLIGSSGAAPGEPPVTAAGGQGESG